MFTDVFTLYRQFFKPIFPVSLVVALLYMLAAMFPFYEMVATDLEYNEWFIANLPQFLDYEVAPFLFGMNTIVLLVSSTMGMETRSLPWNKTRFG